MLIMQDTKPDRRNLWFSLILLPFVMLVLIALFQMLVHFSSPPTGLVTAINVFSVIAGFAAVILLVLLPVWFVMMVKGDDAGSKSRNTAVLLAILLGFFTWLYTYEKDSTKFWVNLVLSIVTLGLWAFVAWVWAIVDTIIKPDEFYDYYNRNTPE